MELFKLINIELYNTHIMVYFGQLSGLLDKLSKYLRNEDVQKAKELFGDVEDGITLARTCLLESGQIVLWMPKPPITPEEKGTLQHEIFHAANNLMEKVGIRLTLASDEAYAYLIGYISTKVEEFLTTSSGDAQLQSLQDESQHTSEKQTDQS